MPRQQILQLNPVKNSALLSSHWIEHRLQLEPEWDEIEEQARATLDALGRIWKAERNRVARYGSEASLEQAFIQPVFETLGWKIHYQTFLQGRKPDYALFLDDASLDRALAAGRNSPDFWKHPTLVADAKAWHVSLDRPGMVENQREYPPQQVEWYLDRSQLDFGILTNGRLWRLIPRQYSPQQRRFQTYLECDLPELLNAWSEQRVLIDDFKEFFLFFSPVAFASRLERKPLIIRALEGSSEYRLGVGDSLQDRAFEALQFCVEGFLTFPPNGLNPQRDLPLCREQSFVLLYRLLFLMFAEDRRLLPYRVNQTYTNNRSMGRYRDEVASRLDLATEQSQADYSRESTDLWDYLCDLFDLVDHGHRAYGVPAYNGGLFDSEQHRFLAEKKIPDYYLARIIDRLGRAPDPEHLQAGLFRVDYRDLAIQHLGSIYESLLELHPHHAAERMVVVSRRAQGQIEQRVLPEGSHVPTGFSLTDITYRPGTVFLQTNKGERRATGSYYTPDHIVDHIVDHTLGPLVRQIGEQLTQEIDAARQADDGARISALEKDFDDRVLRLRVLDPAMGSGHFLIRACQYLAEEIATNPLSGDSVLAEADDEESALSFWKRKVAECCLYGVDLNSLAVELAKLALWLETVAINRPLTFLDHHLRMGNSLLGARLGELGALPGEIELRASAVAQQVAEQLPVLLKPLAKIRETPSETVTQIKTKERLYKQFEKRREPFRQVADLWCSTFVARDVSDEEFQAAVDAVAQPRRFAAVARQPWFSQAMAHARRTDIEPFHWELEFLEVFFNETGRRADAGFDAIIGNPPYDVLSELESQRDLRAFKEFIDHEAIYAPSRSGKNNLYKLFVCRALDMLASDGYFGFITPMAILGDKITAELRLWMIEVASFTGIEAFPQKDNPNKRVFQEAKLSTAVFTMRRGAQDGHRFRARVHPARYIETDSPSYCLSTADIPLYDPVNYSIVSCSQSDWDLATRIMQSGRLVRLNSYATSFQGEINETNDRVAGRISYSSGDGPEVMRGAHLCLYALREASQGTPVYVLTDAFLEGRRIDEDQKAFHHRYERIGFQRKSPQNNFRRLIAARIPQGVFLLESISYIPSHRSTIPLDTILALLNSKLCEWYFRLGSTNAMVAEYQVGSLPAPLFSVEPDDRASIAITSAIQHLGRRQFDKAFLAVEGLIAQAPFSPADSATVFL